MLKYFCARNFSISRQLCPVSRVSRQIKYFVRRHRTNHTVLTLCWSRDLFLSPFPETAWICIVRLYISFLKMWFFPSSSSIAICQFNSHASKKWLFKKCGTFDPIFVISSTFGTMPGSVNLLLLIIFPNYWWLSVIVFVTNKEMFESLTAYHLHLEILN